MSRANYNDLLEAGVHFGHLTRKWNPAMAPYIFMEKNGIHIIDLNKTVAKLDEACEALKQIAKSGKKIMFVATKKQAKDVVAANVKNINMPYVTERWPGGMLTNFATIRKAIKKMGTIDRMATDGTWENINKKERLLISREREKLEKTTRKVVPRGLRTEREMNQGEYNQYLAAINQYQTDGDEQKLLNFYDKFGWLESEQARNRRIAKEGEPSVISPAKTQSEMDAEKETATKTASGRAEAAGKMEARLGLQAEAAFENTNIAKDMIGYAKNNPLVFDLMNRPGLGNAIARAIQEGVNVGNFSINLPVGIIKQYELSSNDLTALQMFMQKSAQLQSRGRQLNRTPGEGSTSDYETKLLGGIYALPSDSQRAIILKSDALIMQGMFDEERFKLWTKKSKESGYTYNDFLIDDDFKELKTNYRKKLDAIREENMDLLSPKKKDKNPPANPSNAPATKLSPNDSSVPPGYIKDPKTGVIRKKREGE